MSFEARMKILWIAPYPMDRNAHAASWITSLAKAIVAEGGISLTILTISSGQANKEMLENRDGLSMVSLSDAKDRMNLLLFFTPRIVSIRKWVKTNKHQFDLIHIHGTEYLFHVATLGIDIPTVVSIQGLLHLYHRALPTSLSKRKLTWMLNGALESFGMRWQKSFICRTSWDTEAVKSLNPSAKIYTAWEMIREDFFTDQTIEFSNNKNILFMGGTSSFKGIVEALQVFSSLLRTHQITMTVIGGGCEKELDDLIKQNELYNLLVGQNIFHLGMKDAPEICELMAGSFCLLHPSYIDNSPNSVCEAQVFGLPVVASDVGGVSSLIKDRETGLLTSLEIGDICENVQSLFDDADFGQRISVQALQVARERHKPSKILNSYKYIYQELAS
jgi:glycosyltransferase involved in cell wall biosynthesis